MVKKYRYATTEKKNDVEVGSNNDSVVGSKDTVKTTIMVRYYPLTRSILHDTIIEGSEEVYIESHKKNRHNIPLFNIKGECVYYGDKNDVEGVKVKDVAHSVNAITDYIKIHS